MRLFIGVLSEDKNFTRSKLFEFLFLQKFENHIPDLTKGSNICCWLENSRRQKIHKWWVIQNVWKLIKIESCKLLSLVVKKYFYFFDLFASWLKLLIFLEDPDLWIPTFFSNKLPVLEIFFLKKIWTNWSFDISDVNLRFWKFSSRFPGKIKIWVILN